MDDVTFGKMFHCGTPRTSRQLRTRRHGSQSQSSSFVMFDGSGQRDRENMVDGSGNFQALTVRTHGLGLFGEERQTIPCSSRRGRAPTSTRRVMATEIGIS